MDGDTVNIDQTDEDILTAQFPTRHLRLWTRRGSRTPLTPFSCFVVAD